MPRRLLVVITTEMADGVLRDLVRSRAGDDAEMLVVAPVADIVVRDRGWWRAGICGGGGRRLALAAGQSGSPSASEAIA